MSLGSISAVKARVPKKPKEENAMKKGGKAKVKDESIKQIVNVNVNSDMIKPRRKQAKRSKKKEKKIAGDMVVLHKGMPPGMSRVAPMPPSSIMGATRLQSPGLAFGSMPGPLQASSYGSAPQVAKPFSRVEFIGSSDALYNRNRIKSDDIMIQVNPSDIIPDITPSKRLIPSSNPNTPYDYKANELHDFMSDQVMVGRTPILARADITPSQRALPSQPSAGALMAQRRVQVNWSRGSQTDSEPMEPEAAPEKGVDIPNAGRPPMSSKEAMAEAPRKPSFSIAGQAVKQLGPRVASTGKAKYQVIGSDEVIHAKNDEVQRKARGGSVFPFFAHHQD